MSANRISLTFHTGSVQDGYDGDRRIVNLQHEIPTVALKAMAAKINR